MKQGETLKALKSDKNKQDIKSIDGIFLMRTTKIEADKIDEIKQWKEKIKRKYLQYETKKQSIKNIIEFDNKFRPR